MKKIMLSLLVLVSLTACTNHGKKVKIEGTKGEVFYKGDGVTEDDAKKLGKFLKEEEYFDDSTKKSVQLMKAKDAGYDVHLVVDEKKVKEIPNVDERFLLLGAAISKDVFDKQPVNIYLADDRLKDFKTLSYDKKKAEDLLSALETPAATGDNNDKSSGEFSHDIEGGVNFYWKGITDEESKTIIDYIVKSGSFAGGPSHIYITKEGNRYILHFPVKQEALDNPEYLAALEKVTKEIKDNVFANVPYSFYATDTKMAILKAWDYLE